MKKYILSLPLLALLVATWHVPALAQKKYRYIKREHGVKFQGNLPFKLNANGFQWDADFQGAYTYNWKGFVEVGPYFGVSANSATVGLLTDWKVGLLVEYNIIKNRGKRKLIPAIGIQGGVINDGLAFQYSGGAHATLKWFVAKRTAFITNLQYDMVTPLPFVPAHHINLSMGFSYFFDFY